MDEFLRLATTRLGVSEQTARGATSELLKFLQQKARPDSASMLLDKLPGARELLAGASSASRGRTSGVLGALGNLLGGKAGTSLVLLALLQNVGLDNRDAGRFVGMFVDFARQKVGAGVVDGLLAQIPELESFAG